MVFRGIKIAVTSFGKS